jgi:hypothetical protein
MIDPLTNRIGLMLSTTTGKPDGVRAADEQFWSWLVGDSAVGDDAAEDFFLGWAVYRMGELWGCLKCG